VPPVGAVVRRGQRLFEVDGHRVPLFYGRRPLWRPVTSGVSDGPDVRAVEQNLAALGHDPGEVDTSFTARTAEAVKDWQDDLGVQRTGTLAPGDVGWAPGPIRVMAVTGSPGGSAAGASLQATGLTPVVTVPLPVDQQELAVPHARVTVHLPGGVSPPGHVQSVGTVATAATPAPGAVAQPGAGLAGATVQVVVTLDRPSATGTLDGAPAQVDFSGPVHRGVLSVPVEALLAQPGGEYGVDVVDAAGDRRLVRVRVGAFAQGRVEVSGLGLAGGMRVEVPSG